MRTFGIDEPMGCYDDIEAANAFVLWGSNMAEMHPVLWTPRHRPAPVRAEGRQGRRAVGVRAPLLRARRPAHHVHAAGGPRDPQLHRELHHPHQSREPRLRRQAHRVQDRQHRHRLRPAARSTRCRRPRRTRATSAAASRYTFDEFAKFVSTYDAERTSPSCRACRRRSSTRSPRCTPIPKVKVMSFFTMGFNQHTRGVWCSNLLYNLHLLTGKISTPGNSPFSLTGQPSACGTAREVGTFSHRLPADMVVANPEASREGGGDLGLAGGHDPDHARLSRGAAEPHAEGRQAQRVLGAGQQQHAGRAQHRARKGYPGYRNPDNFIVVSEAYPDGDRRSPPTSCCPPRCGSRRKARTATRSGARSSGTSWSTRPARRAPTCGSSSSSPSASRSRKCGRPSSSPRSPSYAARRSTTCCSATARSTASRSRRSRRATPTTRRRRSASTCRRACSRSTRQFGRGHGHDLAPFDTYHEARGLRWPVVNGKETRWRFREGSDPYVKAGTGFQFYGNPDGRAYIWALPYEPRRGVARQGVSVLAVDRPRARALALGLDDAPRAGALSRVPERRRVHASRRCARARRAARLGRARRSRAAARSARGSRRAGATACRRASCSCRGSTRASSSTR